MHCQSFSICCNLISVLGVLFVRPCGDMYENGIGQVGERQHILVGEGKKCDCFSVLVSFVRHLLKEIAILCFSRLHYTLFAYDSVKMFSGLFLMC